MRPPAALPRLIGITPGSASDARGAGELLRRALDGARGGLPGVLLREPELGDAALLELARELRQRAPELWIALHDRPHLVGAAGSDAVHLGFRSLRPAELAAWIPTGCAVGLSTHAADDAAAWAGADFLFHGPVHATPKPPSAEQPAVGVEGLRRAVERAPAPVFALGGMTPERVGEALSAGAHGVASLGGLLASEDPRGRAREFLRALERAG